MDADRVGGRGEPAGGDRAEDRRRRGPDPCCTWLTTTGSPSTDAVISGEQRVAGGEAAGRHERFDRHATVAERLDHPAQTAGAGLERGPVEVGRAVVEVGPEDGAA